MKTSPFLVAVAASLMPTLTMGLVGISWNIPNVPTAGLKDITFPFSIADSPHEAGYYFAQSFNFKGVAGVGYTGLLPRPDASGNPAIQALLFSYVPGSNSTDSNCVDGNPDGGPGVSCAVDFSGSYADAYGLEIRNSGGTTWQGTVVNMVTNSRVHVGSYMLPAGTQGITGGQVGYLEYLPWNTGVHTCDSLRYTSMAFGVPTTSASGAGAASLVGAHEYGECVGEVAFKSRKTQFGVKVSVGFK